MTLCGHRHRRSAAILVTAGILFAAAALLLGTLHHRRADRDRLADRQQTTLTGHAARHLETLLQHLQASLRHLAVDPGLLARSRGILNSDFALLSLHFPDRGLVGLYLRDGEGRLVAEYPQGGLARQAAGQALLTMPVGLPAGLGLLQDNEPPLLLVGQPLAAGADRGELVALVDLERFVAGGLAELDATATFSFLTTGDGQFLLHANPRWTGRTLGEVLSPGQNPQLATLLRESLDSPPRTLEISGKDLDAHTLFGGAAASRRVGLAPLRFGEAPWLLALTFSEPGAAAAPLAARLPAPGLLAGLAAITSLVLLGWAGLGGNRRLERANRELEEARDRLQEELARSESRCRQIFDHAGDALFHIAPTDASLLDLNTQAEELLGYSTREIRDLSLAVLFPGRQKRRYLRLVRAVQRHGYAESDDLLFRRKDGSLFAGAVHARLGELGGRQLVHGVLRNVTERKRMESQLRQRNRDLGLLNETGLCTTTLLDLPDMGRAVLKLLTTNFGASGGGLYLARDAGRTLQLEVQQGIPGDLAARLHTLGAKEGIVGRVMATAQPRGAADLQKDRRVHVEAVRKAGWRGFQAVPVLINERVLGVLFLFYERKHLFTREELGLLTAVGRQVGTAVENFNLFEALQWQNRLTQVSNRELEHSRQQLREHLAEMAEAKGALERLERMKSHFLSLASHELRTPLTYVLSGGQFLAERLEETLDEDERRALDAVLQGGRRLDDIVRDLLEVARLESSSLYLARQAVDPEPLLRELLSEFGPRCRQRQMRLGIGDFPSGVRLLGDPHHLRKTFLRLLENAMKFTPPGGWVETTAILRAPADVASLRDRLHSFSPAFFRTPPEAPLLQISIRDNGVGIAPEEHLSIFDTFYEVGDIDTHFTSTSSFGGKGVGLGLALVKGVVEAHGGMVWVESRGAEAPESGSSFHLLLPTVPGDLAGGRP